MKEVKKSWERVSKNFAEKFYEVFLKSDSRILPMFKHTDFNRQKDLLTHSIFVLLNYAEGNAIGQMAMTRLGELHSRGKMNISVDMYSIWLNSFIKVLSEIDPQFTPDLKKKWRDSLQKGVDYMISKF